MKTAAKVAPSRKNLFSVMNNSGFGDMSIRKSGLEIHVPQTAITQSGSVRSRAGKIIASGSISIGDAIELQAKYGIEVTKA